MSMEESRTKGGNNVTTYQAISEAPSIHLGAPRSALARAFTSTRWMGSALALAAIAIAYFVLPQELTRSVYNPMGAGAVVAFFTGIGRVGNRQIWRLLGTGVISYAVADLLGTASPLAGGPSLQTAIAGALYLGAYALIATGLTAIFCSIRRSRR
jgi:hypothetical protein